MCSEQFHFILVSFSSEAPFGFVQLAPYREGVKVSGNNQGPKDPMKESLWQYWLLTFKCQMNFLLKKNPLSTLCQVIGKWTVWQLTNDIDRVPCSSLAPDCRHWCRAKPSSSEGLYGGRPTFFARQSTLFIDLWFFMAACHTTLVKSLDPSLGIALTNKHQPGIHPGLTTLFAFWPVTTI